MFYTPHVKVLCGLGLVDNNVSGKQYKLIDTTEIQEYLLKKLYLHSLGTKYMFNIISNGLDLIIAIRWHH